MTVVRAILGHWSSRMALGYLFTLTILALLFPWVSAADPNTFNPMTLGPPIPPSWPHILGTDELNRDIFLRIIAGGRISLMVGVLSVVISTTIGTIVGVVAGYSSPIMDGILMRCVDIMMAIPSIFLILTLQVILEPRIETVMIVIGCTGWMGVARLVRAQVLTTKHQLFVTAARARGISTLSLIVRYMVPSTIPPIVVAATLGVGYAILTESVLSFLGLGVQPPHPSWGNMLQNSLSYITDAPWMAIVPGVFITLTVVSFSVVGDHIQQMTIKQHHAPYS